MKIKRIKVQSIEGKESDNLCKMINLLEKNKKNMTKGKVIISDKERKYIAEEMFKF